MKTNIDFKNKTAGCFLGIAIGDMMGAPFEMLGSEKIFELTNGKGVTGFDHGIKRKDKIGKEIEEDVTDDFNLSWIIQMSLISCGSFDIHDIALRHVKEYLRSTAGWGGTTRNGIKEIYEYYSSFGEKGRNPLVVPKFEAGKGCGNGVAMKIAPIALHFLSRKNKKDFKSEHYSIYQLGDMVASIGKLTHPDPRAWCAAYALCLLYYYLDFYNRKMGYYMHYIIPNIISKCQFFERKYGSAKRKPFSKYLSEIQNDVHSLPIDQLAKKTGTSSASYESVVFAIAVILRNIGNFKKGMYEAINYSIDSDSVGSMVGGALGYHLGNDAIPIEWRNHSDKFIEIEKLFIGE